MLRLPEKAKFSPRGQSTPPVPGRSLVRFTLFITAFPLSRNHRMAAELGLISYSLFQVLLFPSEFQIVPLVLIKPDCILKFCSLLYLASPKLIQNVPSDLTLWLHWLEILQNQKALLLYLEEQAHFIRLCLFCSPWEHSLLSTQGCRSFTRP